MAGKTLKELKDRVDVVQASQLDMRLNNNTLIAKYVRVVDEYLKAQMKSPRGHISLPTMQYFMDLVPNYKEELESLYVEKMQGVDGYELVNVETMIAQAALFDSLCFVYDSEKNEYSLATMNFELLYDLDVEYDMLKQVYAKNKKGIVKAYRIDVEYSNSDQEFTFKAVNARDFDIDESKPDCTEGKRFFLVPYMFSIRFMKIVESRLNKGTTLRVHQQLDGIEKVRFISKNEIMLASKCDIPDAVKGIEAKFFPLKGFFYAPSVGAPSTSAMITNINVFDVSILKGATENDFKNFKINKPENPIRDMIGENLVINRLMYLKGSDLGELSSIVRVFPYKDKYHLNIDDLQPSSIAKYLHSVPEASMKKIYKVTGVEEELSRRLKLFSNGRAMTADEIANIEETLKNNICRVVLQKKNCKLSSVMCTNNKDILANIYGKDYIKYYEGFSSRFYMFLNKFKNLARENFKKSKNPYIKEDILIKELSDTSLPSESKDVSAVWNILARSSSVSDSDITFEEDINGVWDTLTNFEEYLNSASFEERLKGYFADKMGVSLRRSNAQSDSVSSSKETGTILVRGLSAYIDANGSPVEYYKNVDRSKIISGIVF